MRNRIVVLPIAFSLLTILPSTASSQGPADARQSAAAPAVPNAQVLAQESERWTEVDRRLAAIEATTRAAETNLASLASALVAQSKPSSLTTVMPAIIAALAGLLGVGIGGFANYRVQQRQLDQQRVLADARATQDRELSESQSRLQIGTAVVEWQLRQLSLLYGPLRALLGQSFALYRQMNQALVRSAGDRFRFVEGDSGIDGQIFEIKLPAGQWERFRLVMHLAEVYGKGYGVETYVAEIVAIGARIEKIIQEHAGYGRPEQKELMSVLARYLAHFAVLKNVCDQARTSVARPDARDTAGPSAGLGTLRVDLSAVFPQEIHTLVNEGFEAISREVDSWRQKATTA